jgi:hypothetical protein
MRMLQATKKTYNKALIFPLFCRIYHQRVDDNMQIFVYVNQTFIQWK